MTTRDVSLTGIPRMGRATAIGALIGALIVAVPVGVFLVSLSADPMSFVAGVHVGFFGGMGYGGMVGAVIQASIHEDVTRSDVVGSGDQQAKAKFGRLEVDEVAVAFDPSA